jgi:hypothetical protein
MSASQASALDVISFQLAAALDTYDQDLEEMVETWLDMDLYGKVSDEIEEIRRYSAALPQLSVPWVELLIAHGELVHSLWRLRFQEVESDRERLAEVRDRHTACVRSLKARCVRMLARHAQQGA